MTGSSQPPILKARGITKSFGGFRVVNDMSLELAASEILGVIGPNGAGKSTLFNLLAGALPVDAWQHPSQWQGSHQSTAGSADPVRPRPHLPDSPPVPPHDGSGERHDGGSEPARRSMISALVAPRQVAAAGKGMSRARDFSISFRSRILRISPQRCFRAGSANCSNLPAC
jgi:branched-chain amino acid transport system ATP-binding protein